MYTTTKGCDEATIVRYTLTAFNFVRKNVTEVIGVNLSQALRSVVAVSMRDAYAMGYHHGHADGADVAKAKLAEAFDAGYDHGKHAGKLEGIDSCIKVVDVAIDQLNAEAKPK